MLITESNRKWWVFLAAGLVLVMTNIDFTAVNLALAPIANEFHANLSTLQWIITGYSSAAAAFAMIGGKLGDGYGYRKVFICGVIIFTVASVFIGCSSNTWNIVALRIIQGAGGAICWPLCIVAISNAFPKEQQGHAIGMSLAVAVIALAIGPTFGGVLLHFLSWRWIFFINLPLGILTVFLAAYLMPGMQQQKNSQLHVTSMLLVVIGLLSVTTALNEGQQWGLSSWLFQLLFWCGIIFLGIFIHLQRTIQNPILNLHLLDDVSLRIGLLLRVLNQIILVSILFTLGLLLQNILNYSALIASLILCPLTIACGIASFSSGKLIDKYGARRFIFIGMTLNFIACIFFTQISATTNIAVLILPLIMAGAGVGCTVPALFTVVLKKVALENRGTVAGINYVSVFLGSGFAAIISGWILHIQSAFAIHKLSAQLPAAMNTTQISNLKSILTGANSIQHLTVAVQAIWIQQAFIHALSIIMLVCAVVAVVSLLVTLKISRDF